jgi:hypothetical protein
VRAVSRALSLLLRVVLSPLRLLIAVVVVLDELARPVYGPVVRWFSGLALIRRAEAAIAALPPYVVLLVLAVPLIGVEPLKILAVYWIGTGQVLPGLVLLAFAYAASFLVVERIYHAGHEKLMRIGWFAVIMGYIVMVRDRVIAWSRRTAIWRLAHAVAGQVRAVRLALVARVRRMLGRAAAPPAPPR